MVKVTIDSIECDFDSSTSMSLVVGSDTTTNLQSGRTAQTIEFKLPSTVINSAIFGLDGDVHPSVKFNSEWHPMTIELDGVTLLSGTAYLMQIVWSDDERYFVVECRGGVIDWASDAATTLFKNIGLEYSNTLNLTNIKASWEDSSPIKYFPVIRDSYDSEASSVDVTGVRVTSSIDDYHPFIQVSALLEAIFAESGYTVESTTAQQELFDTLYVSGNYSSSDNSSAKAAMGFYVKRLSDTSTTTDSSGRVSMSPYDAICTVGNIVDLESVDSDTECYNYGGVLQYNGEALEFVPTTEICVGFEYYLHYTCMCKIESRSTLQGINTLKTITNGDIEWEIANRYVDCRDSWVVGIYYTLVIFNFVEGETYRIVGLSMAGSSVVIVESSVRVKYMTVFTQEYQYLNFLKYGENGYETCNDDWAIYAGYVNEYSLTEVKATVRSAPKDYSPTSPMQFELQLLSGASAGVDFTLHAGSSIRPFFSDYPGYNSTVTFEDIAQHSYYAVDFLSSLQHLFNLRFSTLEEAKKVTIESFDEFFNGESFDWSDKLVEGVQVEFVDYAQSAYRYNTYGYQQTDGVVQRLGESDNAEFGEWSFSIDSYVASSSSHTVLNTMFSATTNDDDGVLLVGDRDDETTVDSLNFSPRIVRYFEMIALDGENSSIPYAAFHAPDKDFTLCFEDRDGVTGLNRLYNNYVELLGRSQIITLSLQLTVLDYTNLFAPCSFSASQRSIFYFELHGERFKTILHSIESYDPQSGVARCSFLTID